MVTQTHLNVKFLRIVPVLLQTTNYAWKGGCYWTCTCIGGCLRRVHKIAISDNQHRHVCTYGYLSVRLSAWNNSAPIEGIFMKFISTFFEKSVEKIQFALKSGKNSGYFTWRPIHIFDQFFSELEMFRKKVVEKIETYFTFKKFLFSKSLPFMGQCGRIMLNRTGHRW